ncbi:histidine kinase [Pedobacter sp. KR3-3]|uniref:Histidine kinase n=1 Tax=Pedobacter albus TaxID=3113905 RepID=A0ABU7IC46_9SPHI|nr:histidine kinase [Pedobacter sp. KR3-3]MEE1947060.1 histidine kinase [Pedobacter sp. KR3-3]
MGLILGLLVYFAQSAIANALKPVEYLIASLTFSTSISLTIANMVHFATSTKILRNWENVWRNFTIYYLISFAGMIMAVELTYLVLGYFYHWESQFPHTKDYLFDSILVLVVCTLIYVDIYRKALQANKLNQKELELHKMNELRSNAELEALQAKINPHFLYNALNSIAGLIKDNPDQAEEMTIKLSKLFRYSINQSQENLVSIREEAELLSLYLEIEKIRFGNRVTFEVNIGDGLYATKIPRFLIQPLVENALKHGLKYNATNGSLKVNIFAEASDLVIQVADNGQAFATDLVLGYGLQSTFDKVQLLYGANGKVELINNPEKMVQIKIPLAHA